MKPRTFFISLAFIFPFALFTQISFRHSTPAQLHEPYQDIEVKMYPLEENGGVKNEPATPLCQIDDPSTPINEGDTR